jgi:anaerobic selenocysteine-containing dehydrogenase
MINLINFKRSDQPMSEEKEKIVRTTVWSPGAGCHGGCGVKLHVKNGRLVKEDFAPGFWL